MTESFSLSARLRSFGHALAGVGDMLRTQHNAWIHLLASAVVMVVAVAVDISRFEWSVLILAMVAVWVAEALNTAFELLCDVASPDFHPLVKRAKDVAAGAVLLSAVGAVAVGLVVFLPYLAGPP